ncbi:lysis system i-spanin subunit Rz [Paraburkholderia phytofirmans]|uniref:lysis system i-spanin subunit Rz n=1 Tax=Paraburkholderia phytofirmans TaxID=261302 RepID=UPI0038BAA9F7
MSPYLITGLGAALLGIAIGAGGTHALDSNHYGVQLATERAARARDNEQHATDLNLISKAALDAENRAIETHTVAEGKIATLDNQLTKEKEAHEADNSSNRRAIADGTRRLRIAVANFQSTGSAGSDPAGSGAGAGGLGDGASGTAELPRPFGLALFTIVDDADKDARAKADYLQHYVCVLQRQGLVTGTCELTDVPD